MPIHMKILIGLLVGAVLGIGANVVGQQLVDATATKAAADAKSAADAAGNKSAPTITADWYRADVDNNKIADGVDYVATGPVDFVGKIFLRIILMVVVPLVVSALVLGVLGVGDPSKIGRIGIRTLVYTAILSTIAVIIGVTLVNVIKPGKQISSEKAAELQKRYAGDSKGMKEKADKSKTLKQTLLDMLPENPLQEMVGAVDGSSKGNGMLAVMVFSLVIGIALLFVDPAMQDRAKMFFEVIFEICMKVIEFAMRLAPIAVACLTFTLTSQIGFNVLGILLSFAFTVILAC